MHLSYNKLMAVKDSNKQMNITISKELYEKLSKIADVECRSVSKQALLFLLDGLKNYEGKRD